MTDRVFVDTNILVYAHDRGAGRRHRVSKALLQELWQERRGVLSTQVIQEFFVNVHRKASRPISAEESKRLVDDYLRWEIVVNDGRTILGAIDLERRFQVSFWDAMILQAAKAGQTPTVYSEDLNHGQFYDGVQVINPFLDSQPSRSARI